MARQYEAVLSNGNGTYSRVCSGESKKDVEKQLKGLFASGELDGSHEATIIELVGLARFRPPKRAPDGVLDVEALRTKEQGQG